MPVKRRVPLLFASKNASWINAAQRLSRTFTSLIPVNLTADYLARGGAMQCRLWVEILHWPQGRKRTFGPRRDGTQVSDFHH
jgi:hypothetical protein